MKTNDISKTRNPMRPQCMEWVSSLVRPLATSMIQRSLYADVEQKCQQSSFGRHGQTFFPRDDKIGMQQHKKFNIELVACGTIQDFVLSTNDRLRVIKTFSTFNLWTTNETVTRHCNVGFRPRIPPILESPSFPIQLRLALAPTTQSCPFPTTAANWPVTAPWQPASFVRHWLSVRVISISCWRFSSFVLSFTFFTHLLSAFTL